MPRLIIERFDPPISHRNERVRSWARERAAVELGGRHVWCAAASPRGLGDARRLGERLSSGGALAADPVDVDDPGAWLHELARRLDALLAGPGPTGALRLDADERARCAEAAAAGEAALGREVRPGDVVVVHDSVAALAAQALRARGAHVVWRLASGSGRGAGTPAAAVETLSGYTGDVDAYISSAVRRLPNGRLVRHVAAFMPGADVLAAKEVVDDPDQSEVLGWRAALADVVTDDHADHVGGRLHVRPAVAVR
jgi:hypothetical protein